MKQHDAWLVKALHDLKSAHKLISGNDPILDTAVYHAQQCAEKSLKAYLSFKNIDFSKTHDLQLLLEQCIKLDDSFNTLYDTGIELNPYATLYRYPGPVLEPDLSDVNEAISIAERIMNFIKDKI